MLCSWRLAVVKVLLAAPVGAVAAEVAQNLSAPRIPQQWSARVRVAGDIVGSNVTDGDGVVLYDGTHERYRITYTAANRLFFANGTSFSDQLYQNVPAQPQYFAMGENEQNSVCMPFRMPYADLFAWLRNSTLKGKRMIGDAVCDVWEFDQDGEFGHTHNSACIDANNFPVMLIQSTFGPKFNLNTTYYFSEVRLGFPEGSPFQVPAACKHLPRPCESDDVSTISVYRVWAPPEPMVLANRNTGDIMGDLSFMCTQASGEAYRSKLITHWSVEASHAWGEYAMCNYNGTENVCVGEQKRVGRRGSQMLGGLNGGQCSANQDIGSQYSFPRDAMCNQGTSPSTDGECAWGNAHAMRTVRAECILEERGLLAACRREFGHAPFAEAARIWQNAFASADAAQGGCPDAFPTLVVV